jgi:EAL domain-containing protein (putative c-di-GMP-specific phosphodiesterase class I)/GGDEF domain-containing protein
MLILFVIIEYFIIRIVLNANEHQRLNYLFNHDQLTYLLNSYGMEKLFNKKYKEKENGILIILTINKFQLLIDRFGSDKLDLLLLELGNKFKSLSKNVYVGRTSDNEFTFLMFNSNNIAFIEKILLLINNYRNESIYKNLSVSISYVLFPKFSDKYEILVKYGHSALSNHSNELNNVISEFDEKIYTKYLEEEMLVNEIKTGILNSDFLLYYQPQIDLDSGVAIGAEVLIRWEHKNKGFIYPNQFLPIAEKNGLMRILDFYMIKNVCKQIKFWQDNNYKKMKISVNMTSSTFESENMIDDMLQVLKETEIDTSWLVVEITEESGFGDMNNAKILMNAIKKTGIRFALDDFGTGYSSLSYLDELPFDFLKVDKAFIDNIHLDEKSYSLYNLIVNLAKLFNMEIIAEGVECIEQLDIIKENKNIVIQGYYYSKALKIEAFEKYLQNN